MEPTSKEKMEVESAACGKPCKARVAALIEETRAWGGLWP
jgi:hypothetical protein